jgi:hypothetical protein
MNKPHRKQTTMLIICGILSLSIGIAFASPLLASELNIIPFYSIPEGPKAEFNINTVYAKFDVQNPNSNYSLATVNYQIVLNITNPTDIAAKLSHIEIAAAQNITVVMGALSGFSANSGGGVTGGGGGGQIEGLWLDDEWVNITWIPGTYPQGLEQIYTDLQYQQQLFDMGIYGPNWPNQTATIPNLPENASETGYWMEGVPIIESHIVNASTMEIKTYTAIFINGSWVDVTGRINVNYPQPQVLATTALIHQSLLFPEIFAAENSNETDILMHQTKQVPDTFNSTWAPHTSRLVMLSGTLQVGTQSGLESLAAGTICLYAGVFNYVNDQPINGTLYNTCSSTIDLKQVQLTTSADGYLYNTILSSNQVFQLDQFGIEVFVKEEQ